MTELSGLVSTLNPEPHRDESHPERPTSAGGPLPGIQMRVVDPVVLRDVEPGESGELWFRTPQVMKGYWGRPEATAETITQDGWLRTGDIGRVDDGGFVFIVDRLKDTIISGGENIYSPEVEQVISAHPAVAEVAIIGIPDEKWGEIVKAVVAPKPGKHIDPDELIAVCKQGLAGYKCPRSVEVMDALPRNATGKSSKRISAGRTGSTKPPKFEHGLTIYSNTHLGASLRPASGDGGFGYGHPFMVPDQRALRPSHGHDPLDDLRTLHQIGAHLDDGGFFQHCVVEVVGQASTSGCTRRTFHATDHDLAQTQTPRRRPDR